MKSTKNNFIKKLNILDGIIVYNDFDIQENIPFEKQWYSYKEDMLQVQFGDRFILDVGWYPEDDQNGNFTVLAIENQDWMNPVSQIKCKTLDELKKAIEKTAKVITEKRKI